MAVDIVSPSPCAAPETAQRVEKLLYIRSKVGGLIEEAERLLGITDGFPVTVEFARVYDEIGRQIQACSGYKEVEQ